MARPGETDDDVPAALPSLRELPPLESDEVDVPFFDRPSSLAIEDEDSTRPSLDERDAVEGLSIDELIDPIDDEPAPGDDDVVDESFDTGIDEAPDDDALGDDDDGLGNDAADLDESLLTSERPDDGADGLDGELVEVEEPTKRLDEFSDDDEPDDPIVLPPLPRNDP